MITLSPHRKLRRHPGVMGRGGAATWSWAGTSDELRAWITDEIDPYIAEKATEFDRDRAVAMRDGLAWDPENVTAREFAELQAFRDFLGVLLENVQEREDAAAYRRGVLASHGLA